MERRVIIPTTCFCDLRFSGGPPPRRGYPLLIALHGYGGTEKSMLALAERICGDQFAIASLQGPHQHIQRRGSREVRITFGWGWDSSPTYRRSATDILHISGTRDPFYPLDRVSTFKARLEKRGRSVEHVFVPTRHVFPKRCIPTIRRWLLDRI